MCEFCTSDNTKLELECELCHGIGIVKMLVGYARYDANSLKKEQYVKCPKCQGVEQK
ncbi:hypothetical protein [Listeria seeligeri]|uniref:hypothetical protein n=1 Tax=Listeria seeligeri TaxID=1640 RepID=UPI0022EA3241|nr:hypothetical protein [Listeria seeligeri]